MGPEPESDYPNLQDAVENTYNCGPFVCPLGIAWVRLSTNYNHSGFTLLDNSLKIQGGYSSLLTVYISPDDASECELAVTVESHGIDRDTELSNNFADYEATDCQLSDLIFEDCYE